MYTFCPECHTTFRVKADHLHAAGGQVRCGECRYVFSAVECLFDELSAAREAMATGRASAEQQELEEVAAEEAAVDTETELSPADELVAESDFKEMLASSESLVQRVSGGAWIDSVAPLKNVFAGAGIAVLVLLIGTQWVFFNRDALAADSNWRPALERFCAVLHCALPLRVDLARIELTSRDVRKHPLVKDALLINATLVNQAGFTQPYPVFEISFSGLSGEPVAMRRFRPAEYLGGGGGLEAGMAPGAPVHVVLEILDPGEEAVSFQFGFL